MLKHQRRKFGTLRRNFSGCLVKYMQLSEENFHSYDKDFFRILQGFLEEKYGNLLNKNQKSLILDNDLIFVVHIMLIIKISAGSLSLYSIYNKC